jgi:hypothetical protein
VKVNRAGDAPPRRRNPAASSIAVAAAVSTLKAGVLASRAQWFGQT